MPTNANTLGIARRQMLGGLLAATALTTTVTAQAGTPRNRLVVLVRHAEKAADDPRDPSLSAAGQQRAEALAQQLAGLPIDRILVTPLRRTQLTAAPTAKALGVVPQAIDFGAQLTDHIAASAAAASAGGAGVSLLVGHSNTVPLLVEALGGPAGLVIDEDRYEDLFLLLLQDDQQSPWFLRAAQGHAGG